jgi:hypothetical protein
MMHWAEKYVGGKWTNEQDCFWWYRHIKKEQFGRDVPICKIDHSRLVQSAARIMTGDIHDIFGYHKTDTPTEGDAVFLSQRNQPHHLGMVILPGARFHIIHALEGVGVIVSDRQDIKINGWSVKGYWTDED